jgi:hypothetical protein
MAGRPQYMGAACGDPPIGDFAGDIRSPSSPPKFPVLLNGGSKSRCHVVRRPLQVRKVKDPSIRRQDLRPWRGSCVSRPGTLRTPAIPDRSSPIRAPQASRPSHPRPCRPSGERGSPAELSSDDPPCQRLPALFRRHGRPTLDPQRRRRLKLVLRQPAVPAATACALPP